MNRKANLPAKRRKSATLIDFKSNFSTSQPARNVSEDQLLEGELLSRSLRAANQKPNQSMRQDGLETEWSMMRRKPATNRRNSANTRFMSPIKTPVSQPRTDFNAQKNQPKYLFQDELDLLKNEAPVFNQTNSTAVIVKRDGPSVQSNGHSMKSLALDVVFCEQCASFMRASGTRGTRQRRHQHQTELVPDMATQAIEPVWKQRTSGQDSDSDDLKKTGSKSWSYEKRFDSDSD